MADNQDILDLIKEVRSWSTQVQNILNLVYCLSLIVMAASLVRFFWEYLASASLPIARFLIFPSLSLLLISLAGLWLLPDNFLKDSDLLKIAEVASADTPHLRILCEELNAKGYLREGEAIEFLKSELKYRNAVCTRAKKSLALSLPGALAITRKVEEAPSGEGETS